MILVQVYMTFIEECSWLLRTVYDSVYVMIWFVEDDSKLAVYPHSQWGLDVATQPYIVGLPNHLSFKYTRSITLSYHVGLHLYIKCFCHITVILMSYNRCNEYTIYNYNMIYQLLFPSGKHCQFQCDQQSLVTNVES